MFFEKGKTYHRAILEQENTFSYPYFKKNDFMPYYPTFPIEEDISLDVGVYMEDISQVGNVASIYIQIEEGPEAPVEYTKYIEDITEVTVTKQTDGGVEEAYTPRADGVVEGVMSSSPSMLLSANTNDAVINCTYNVDTNKAIERLTDAIISLGGNV